MLLAVSLACAACDGGPELTPYDYGTREKAKVRLPRNTSVDVDTDEFILKRKIPFPASPF